MDEFAKRKWRARIKKRRGKSFHPGAIRELNLVAMMDMLTVVLVFLLKSYSVSAMSIPVGDAIDVPKSSNTIRPGEAVKLTVTKLEGQAGVIAVDEERVIELTPQKVGELEAQARRRDFMIPQLRAKLDKKAESIKFIASKNPSQKFEGKILLIADKKTPYWLVTALLYTAAEAGFEQYNLVAMKEVQE
jgi:biopolymer transport protein ExbD